MILLERTRNKVKLPGVDDRSVAAETSSCEIQGLKQCLPSRFCILGQLWIGTLLALLL